MFVNGNSFKLGLYFKASPKDIVIYSGLTAISFITLSDASKSYDLSVQCTSDSYLIFVNGQQQTVVNNFHSTVINGSIAMPIVYRIAYSVSFPIVVGKIHWNYGKCENRFETSNGNVARNGKNLIAHLLGLVPTRSKNLSAILLCKLQCSTAMATTIPDMNIMLVSFRYSLPTASVVRIPEKNVSKTRFERVLRLFYKTH